MLNRPVKMCRANLPYHILLVANIIVEVYRTGKAYNVVFRRPPVRDKRPLRDSHYLRPYWHRVLSVVILVLLFLVVAARLDGVVDFVGELLAVLRVGPDVAPVLASILWIPGADNLEHVLDTVS